MVMKVVEVVWDDAHVTTDSKTVRQAEKIKPVRTHTVAFLLAENEHGISLATDTYPDSPKEGAIVNFIPWGMVVEYWEYK